MSVVSELAVKLVRGLDGVAAKVGCLNAENILKAQEALRAGNKDTFHKLGFVGKNADALKKFENLNWLDRQIIVFRNWITELFSGPIHLIEKGVLQFGKGYDDLVRLAKQHFPMTAAAAKAEATLAASHADEVKALFGNSESVGTLVQRRLTGAKFKPEEADANHLFNELMTHLDDDKNYRGIIDKLKLSPAEKDALRVKVRNREKELYAQLSQESAQGKFAITEGATHYVPRGAVTDASIRAEAKRLARVEALSVEGHLDDVILKDKTLRTALDKAVGLKPELKPGMKHDDYLALKPEGQAHLQAEFKKVQKKVVAELQEQQKKFILKTKDKTLALTDKQVDALAKKNAEILAEQRYGLTPQSDTHIDEMFTQIDKYHKANLTTIVNDTKTTFVEGTSYAKKAVNEHLVKLKKDFHIQIPFATKDMTGKQLREHLNAFKID